MVCAMLRSFDRTRDVPKLLGCNTRNVHYRWDIFERHLSALPEGAEVLDFGAGSLRETFELAARGFHVTAVDLDVGEMESYARDYDWTSVRHRPTFSEEIPRLGNFAVITAFDVIEHLEDPIAAIERCRSVLARDGLIFCTVPNAWTLSELATRIALRAGRKRPPGEAHLQFKSPRGWRAFFTTNGLSVVEHDMAIGCAVNTWFWSVQLPANMLQKAARRARVDLASERIVNTFAPSWAMRCLDRVDQLAKPITHGLSCWNLFVLREGRS